MAVDKIKLSELMSVYGSLLTEKQRDVVAMYCDCDCTLTEIAAEHGISRQGVRDAVVKAESALLKFEQTLQLAQFTRQLNTAVINGDDKKIVDITKNWLGRSR